MKKLILICFSLFAVLSAQAFEIKNITTAGLLDSSYENDFSSNDVASIVSDNGDVTFLSKAFDPNSAEDMEGHYYNSSTDTSSSIVALKNSEFDPINPGLPVDDGKDYREIASYDSLLISVRDNKENSQLPGEDAQSLFINSTPLIFSGIDKFSAIRLVGNASNATLTFLDQNQKINLVSFVKSAGTWSMVADSHHFLPMLNVTSAVTTASGLFTFYVSSNQLRVYNNNSDSSISLASANQVYLSADSRALFWLYGEDLSMVRVDDVSDWGNLTTDSFQNQIMSVASNVKSGRQMKPAFSESGQFVVYLKEKTVDGKVLNQVYFKNLATFVETQISVISAYDFYHDSFNPSISLNGKYVTFSAIKTNLPPPGFGTRSEDTVHHLWRVTMADSDLESASSKVGFPKIDLAEGEITLVEGGLSVSNDGNHFLALTHFNSNGNDTNRRIYVIDSTYYGRYVAHVNSLNLNDSEFDSLQLSEDGKTVVKLETGLLHLAIIMDNTIGDFTQISPALGTFSVSADGTTVAFQDVNSQLKLYNSTDQSTIDLGAGSNPVISASGERIYYLDGTTLKVQTLQNGAWTKDAVFSMASVLPEFSVSYNGCFVVYEKSGNWYRYNLLSGVEKALDETEVTLSSGAGWSVGKAGSDFKLVNHRLDSSSIIPDSTGLREVLISGDGSQMAKVDSLGNLTIESYSVPDSGSYTVSASESLVAHNATPINFHLNIAGGRDADLELVGMPTATKGSIAQISPLKFEYTPVDDNHEIVTLSFTLR
ncbi:MAG: hypothetical protein KAG98_05320, partial [Lentisphaeria bacterium]|nr:hypothetical protein [Lentisphaeria bacterium]